MENPPAQILIVDDEPGVRTTLAANLELEGFEVAEAESVAEAAELLRKRRFDLLLSDVRMPGIDGVTGLGQLRQIQPDLPAVFITGYDAESLAADAVARGAFTVLSKPVTIDRLVRVLRTCMTSPAVVVVDDQADFLETLVEGLRAAGVQVRSAKSGAEALSLIDAGGVDVCVLDLVMPAQGGVEVMAELQTRAPHVHVVAMTGHDVGELVRAVVRGGAAECLRKPFEVQILSRLIASARAKGDQSSPEARAGVSR